MRSIISGFMAALCATTALQAAEPIATSDGEAPGLSLKVTQLKASNGTLMLRFTIANDSDHAFYVGTVTDETVKTPDHDSVSGVYLVDAANKKKYLVMYDTSNQCLCSRGLHEIDSKQSANLWARFSAPPDDVQKIGVVIPHFLPLDDVPISR
jgi:hypothetical protein